MPYDNWRKRLEAAKLPTVAARRAAVAALKINFSQPTENDEGYYRKPITEKDASGNGKSNIIGWVPVAYYLYDGKLTGDLNGKPMTDDEVFDESLWSWVVSHPIDYETYDAVLHGAPWPDDKPVVSTPMNRLADNLGDVIDAMKGKPTAIDATFDEMERGKIIPAANREVNPSHNQPPPEEVIPPHVEHAQAIDNAIGAAKDLPVTNEAEAALAAGSMNRIAELRLACAKIGKARYEPLLRVYETERDKWLPLVNRASVAEKAIDTKIKTFREQERQRIARENAEIARKQREQEEADARAADRAIAAGLPEAPPQVAEAPKPVTLAPLQATYGRTRKREELKKFAVITDDAAVYGFFRDNEELADLIQKLATNAVRAGVTVPGTTTREGLI